MLSKKFFLTLFFLFLVVFSGMAQDAELKVQLRQSEEPVRLKSLQAQVRIYGYLAETSMTLIFENPNSRTLEGELYFPLPDGAVISGYALDIDGEMVDGVAVEKQKAREVFETEVRRGVDPGLVEKVKGNNFKTRVYPLLPGKTRTIRVVFTDDLRENDGEAIYRLPLRFAEKVENFSLRVEVPELKEKPAITIKGLEDVDFKKGTSGWFTEVSASAAELKAEVTISVPQSSSDLVFVEQAGDGRYYFCIQGSRSPQVNKKSSARRAVIFFDVSGSGEKRDTKLEKEFLSSLLKSGFLLPETELNFISFANKLGQPQKISINNGLTELNHAIDRCSYDGASSFAALTDADVAGADLILLFSDGINTYGQNILPEFSVPVMAVSSCDGADFDFLRAIAVRSGGKMIDLKSTSPIEAAISAAMPFWGIVGKSGDSSVADLVPAGAQSANGRFYVAGVLEGEQARVGIDFGSSAQDVSRSEYDVFQKKAVQGEFLRRLWAGRKVSDLMAAKDENRREIIKLSSRHGVVNEFTSLIVLERVEQYVEHRIIPPASKPAWRNAYFAALEAEEERINQESQKNIENILAMWNSRIEWWQTDFSKVDLNQMKNKKKLSLDSNLERDGGFASETDSDSFSAPGQAVIQSAPVRESYADGRDDGDMLTRPLAVSKSDMSEIPEEKENEVEEVRRAVNPGVAIKAWKPDSKYARLIEKAKDQYAEYLRQKKEHGQAPSFYLDCSDLFKEAGKADLALQILSNLAELELENPALLRILGHRLAQLEELEASAEIFAEVLEMRKEEPQSYRDLALVLGRIGRYDEAINLLYEVIKKTWDSRFPEIEVIALEELNNLIGKAKIAGVSNFKVDERLIKPIDVDLRIVMTWDADMTDMDLWVMEPSGEKAFYSNPSTAIGGLVSRDFTRGYGPEEYMIRQARTGTYEIKTNFFGSTSQKIAGAVTLQVDIFTNYGRENEKRRSVTLRLKENRETFTVAEIEF